MPGGAPLRGLELVAALLAFGNLLLGVCARGPVPACSPGTFVGVGRVRTLAGTPGEAGWMDGTRAKFNRPFRAVVTPDGMTALVTDTLNCRIRSVDLATGEVATFAGEGCHPILEWEGNATGARFGQVTAIAVSPDGATVLVSDEEHPMIRAIEMAAPRRVRTLAGAPTAGVEAGSHNAADGYGTNASFAPGISGLAFNSDGSRVFVVDNLKIRKINTTSLPPAVSTVVSGLQPPAHDVAVSPDDETAFLVTRRYSNSRVSCDIQTIDIDGATVQVLAGHSPCSWADGVGTNANFSIDRSPDGSKLLVGDWANLVIRLVDMTTRFAQTVAGSGEHGYQDGEATAARFALPTGVAFTPDGREALVVDRHNHLIRVVSLGECRNCSAGTYSTVAGAPSCLACPRGMFQSRAGATSCDLCPADTYADLPSSTFCTTCPPGTTTTSNASGCVCIAGINCTAQTDQHAMDDKCSRPCPCTDGCSCGFYRSAACSDYCCPCPAGAYCDCFSACPGGVSKPCPQGTFSRVTHARSREDCQTCPPGHICNDDAGTTEPVPCAAGHFCPATAYEDAIITECPTTPGTTEYYNCSCDYDTQGNTEWIDGAYKCFKCPFGTQQTWYHGQRKCYDCPIVADPCQIPCPVGTAGHIAGQAGEAEACSKCPSGRFSDSVSSLECSACLAGSYNAHAGASTCTTCPLGHYCSAESSFPEPCPVGTYNPSTGADDTTECIACPPGHSSPNGSSSSASCSIATMEPITSTRIVSPTTTSFTSSAVETTPTPVVVDDLSGTASLVEARATISGVSGPDGFMEIEPAFLRILTDMVQSPIHLKGVPQAVRRNLLQAGSVVVFFFVETTDESRVVQTLLQPSFSFVFASRLATETGIATLTATVELVSNVVLREPSVQSDVSGDAIQNLADSADSESTFAIYPIAIGVVVFLCCNVYWFRKRWLRSFKKGGEEKDEEMSDDRSNRQSASRLGPGMDSRAGQYVLQAEALQGSDIGSDDGSSHSIEDENVIYSSSRPPAHAPLSLVVCPPNTMPGDQTGARAPDESLVQPSLVIARPPSAQADMPPKGAFDKVSALPRAPAVLSYVDLQAEPSPVRIRGLEIEEIHASLSSGHSITTSDGEDRGEKASTHESVGDCLLDASGFFRLNDTPNTPSNRRSTLASDDLADLFDVVSMVADGENERYVDGQGVQEILGSLLPTSDNSSVSTLYVRLGREANSRLTLEQLREGWAAIEEPPSAKSHAELGAVVELGSFELQRPASEGSWDSDS